MTINRRSFLRALGITPAAIVAAKYLPEEEAAPTPVQQYESSPLSDGYAIPSDAVVLRIEATDYHALSIESRSQPDYDVTTYDDSFRQYAVNLPYRREVVVMVAGIHQVEQFHDAEHVACSILLRNGAAVDFRAYVAELNYEYRHDRVSGGEGFTIIRLQMAGEVTLRRC